MERSMNDAHDALYGSICDSSSAPLALFMVISATLFVGIIIGFFVGIKHHHYSTESAQILVDKNNRGPHGNEADDNDGSVAVLKGALQLIAQLYNLPTSSSPNKSMVTCNDGKVVLCQTPQQLSQLLLEHTSSSFSLHTNNNDKNSTVESQQNTLLHLLSLLQKYSVNTSNPYFFNQLYGRVDPVSLAAELVTVACNSTSFTYEVAPVFVLIEQEVMKHFAKLVYGDLAESEEDGKLNGIVLPGGSYSNLMSLHVARYSWRTANGYIYTQNEPAESITNDCCMAKNILEEDEAPTESSSSSSEEEDEDVYDAASSDENEEKKEADHHVVSPISRTPRRRNTRSPHSPPAQMNHNSTPHKMNQNHPDLVAFVSAEAHYSFSKAIAVTGINYHNLIKVPTLPDGQMNPAELHKAITRVKQEGRIPFFVAATAGSTVRGSFDNIEEIVKICRAHEEEEETLLNYPQDSIIRHKIWVHVDGAWGGSIVFSDRPDLKSLCKGLSQADSFVMNPHKMLGTPIQTSAFVTKHSHILQQTNSTKAGYLFDSRKIGANYDLGDATFSCSRRADAVKFWAMWKYYGLSGLAQRVEDKVDVLRTLVEKVEESDAFMLACQPWPFNVCFYYLPRRIRVMLQLCGISTKTMMISAKTTDGGDDGTTTTTYQDVSLPDDISMELSKISVELKLRLHKAGEMLIPYQPISNQKADCFRLVLSGKKKFDESDVHHLMHVMDKYGADL